MKFAKQESAGYLVNHLARLFARGLSTRIKPIGLTTGTFPALLELWETDGLTQKELVDRLDIEQATMANTLARMERDGLVVRKKHPSDGRAQRVFLTDRARSLRDPALSEAMKENDDMLAGLTTPEREAFIGLVQKIILSKQKDADRDAPSGNA
ncbi:MarR family winged helix-turn-helix transcriptional regulator [Litoreibacter arenae]|nr:MarR family transcriptional regulator [Litoreibacter arenae]